jgi:hypothetical protein
MMEDEPLAHAPTATADAPNIVAARSTSSHTQSRFRENQDTTTSALMDVEADGQQQQPCQNTPIFSG